MTPPFSLPAGFRAAGVPAGIKASGALDVGLLVADAPCAAAAVFTRNRVRAAPVEISEAHLASAPGRISGVVVNSGCANAVTGENGRSDARAMCAEAGRRTGRSGEGFLVLSTGLIGTCLPMEKVKAGIVASSDQLARGPDAVLSFARALMTTDTREKISRTERDDVSFVGFAKGAGMIHPDMATMLAVIVTDAVVSPRLLQDTLREVTNETFNAISIDGDTSTNDTVVCLASGASGRELEPLVLRAALLETCRPLAKAIVADGEGVHHVVALTVEGARDADDARRVARTVATSVLVKTAVFGRDPNWGRILAAAGRAGVPFDPDACSLTLCGTPVLAEGRPLPFDKELVSARMAAPEWECALRVGEGTGRATVWFSDLTHDYVTFNSSYST
jgi:glutamate N-acetyltransferase/amino-acid N-acetyltransferase